MKHQFVPRSVSIKVVVRQILFLNYGVSCTKSWTISIKKSMTTLISLIAAEVGINVEGMQKLQNQKMWRLG